MQDFIDGKCFPFTFIVNDPSGNSFLQNPNAPNRDEYCKVEHYPRTANDYITMGYNPDLAESQAMADAEKHKEFVQEQSQTLKESVKSKKGGMTEEE